MDSRSLPRAGFDVPREVPLEVPARATTPLAAAGDHVRAAPFAAIIGLSAFLLFSLELLGGRLVLPVFGGSPGVWTTGLCFFTTVLFLGYLYAHLLATRVRPTRAGAIHVAIGLAALGLTLAAPADVTTLRNPALPEALNVIVALAVIAGGPAFLLATTTPLLSSWFAGRGGRDPWWLYATSNGASFVALLAYPFLIEPSVPLSMQRWLLAGGLVVLTTGLAAIILRGRSRTGSTTTADPGAAAAAAEPARAPAPPIRRQALWLVAAAVPAGLLSATTNFLQTDLVSAPFIWIGPLAIYLASFVVAFSARGRAALPAFDRLVPAAATLLWLPFIQPAGWPLVPLLVVELGSFFVLAVAIHGHLALDRPSEQHLTGFYLVLSAGGLVATTLVALVAPLAFSTVLEYPLLIVAGLAVLALLPQTMVAETRRRQPIRAVLERLAPYALVSGVLLAMIARGEPVVALAVLRFVLFGSIVVVAAFTPRLLAGATLAVLAFAIVATAASPLVRVRTFFGVVEVRGGPNVHLEVSGTTIHGVQFTDERRSEPTAYYVRSGPVGEVFDDLHARTDAASVGVVGLGVGTIAAYARPADRLTFFEIDQAVIDIARDPRWFTYLADAPREPMVVLGDARLSLREVAPASYDVLVLDAFSSDSVPAHLLTREALATYLRALRPGGILLFHLSNRYYDLSPAVATTAGTLGLDAVGRTFVPSPEVAARLHAGPTITLIAGAAADVERFRATGWTEPGTGPILSDDYSDLIRTLRFASL